MKAGNTILILGGLGVLAFASGAMNFAKTVRVGFGSVKWNIKESGRALYLKLYFDLKLIISNPSSFAIDVTAVNLVASFNGRPLAKVVSPGNIKIAGKGESAVTVLVGLDSLSLFQNVTDAISFIASGKGLTLDLEGRVNTSGGNVDIKQKVNVL